MMEGRSPVAEQITKKKFIAGSVSTVIYDPGRKKYVHLPFFATAYVVL